MGSIRTFDLRDAVARGFKTFVESGTLYGDGVDYALECGFEQVFSIEIDLTLAEKAANKYPFQDNVHIICGDSSIKIAELCKTIQGPAVFWLDAHFPGADAGIKPYDAQFEYDTKLPLEAELNAIADRDGKDLVICDDLWIYEDGNFESGDFNTHCKNHGQNMTKESICGKNLNHIYEKFSKTHKVTKNYKQQGFVIFAPLA